MSLATVTDEQLRIELWRSFLSTFRSYAMLDKLLSIPISDGTAVDGGMISMGFPGFAPQTGNRFELFLSYRPEANLGSWNVQNMQQIPSMDDLEARMVPFSINPDGTVRFSGADMEMDHAAIEILRTFKAEMHRDKIEVPA